MEVGHVINDVADRVNAGGGHNRMLAEITG
jgi:hypothetical protein